MQSVKQCEAADDAPPWWRHLYDVTALLWLKRCDCKI